MHVGTAVKRGERERVPLAKPIGHHPSPANTSSPHNDAGKEFRTDVTCDSVGRADTQNGCYVLCINNRVAASQQRKCLFGGDVCNVPGFRHTTTGAKPFLGPATW